MLEIWELAISPLLLPMTVLLGLALLYWTFMIFSGIHLDADLDVDADLHLDADGDVDANADAHIDTEIGAMLATLSFLNVGTVPITILVSILVVSMWTIAMFSARYLASDGVLGYLLYIPNLIVSVLVTKMITQPIARYIRTVRKEERERHTIIGKIGILDAANDGIRLSQCRVATDGAPFLINARARKGQLLEKGCEVLVIERSEDEKFYYVESTRDMEI